MLTWGETNERRAIVNDATAINFKKEGAVDLLLEPMLNQPLAWK
jgi:hypothetical protein